MRFVVHHDPIARATNIIDLVAGEAARLTYQPENRQLQRFVIKLERDPKRFLRLVRVPVVGVVAVPHEAIG